jgi:hypothetical protein
VKLIDPETSMGRRLAFVVSELDDITESIASETDRRAGSREEAVGLMVAAGLLMAASGAVTMILADSDESEDATEDAG